MGHPARFRFPAVMKRAVSARFPWGDVTREGGIRFWRQTGVPHPAMGVVSIFETVRRLGCGYAPKNRLFLDFATPVSPACMPGVYTVCIR